MIGKLLSGPSHSEEAAILKKNTESDGGTEKSVFKSLLHSLQADPVPTFEAHEKERVARPRPGHGRSALAKEEEKNPEEVEEVHAQVADIFNILSEGKIKNKEIKTDLRKLLSQLKPEEETGRLVKEGAPGQAGKIADRIAQLLPEGGLNDEKIKAGIENSRAEAGSGRMARTVESGQASKVTARITRLLSEGDVKDEDMKTALRKLLSHLQPSPKGEEGAAEKAGAEAPARPEGNKTELFPRDGGDDKEMAARDKGRVSLSDNAPGHRSPQDRLEKSMAGNNIGRNSQQPADTGRTGGLEISDHQKKIIDPVIRTGPAGGVSEKGLEVKGPPLQKSLQKEERNSPERGTGRSDGPEGERRPLFGLSSRTVDAGPNKVVSAGIEGAGSSTGSEHSSAVEQEILWKEHAAESTEMKTEEKETAQQLFASSSLKLGQIPIANGALRTKILPALTQNALKGASEARKTPEQWQKHRFILDDGKKMQLSVRETQGVLQVKMGSVNPDLRTLLQQHLQQIREHLKQEFGSEIDLQMDQPEQEGPASHFSGHSNASYGNGRDESLSGSEPGDAGKVKLKAVRNFGYNEMEWIA